MNVGAVEHRVAQAWHGDGMDEARDYAFDLPERAVVEDERGSEGAPERGQVHDVPVEGILVLAGANAFRAPGEPIDEATRFHLAKELIPPGPMASGQERPIRVQQGSQHFVQITDDDEV